MADKPASEFGTRKPVAIRPPQPVKRGQVALLLMGTLAVGGGAYAMMPSENCQPNQPGMAAPSGLPTNTECRPRGSSSGGHGSSGGSSSRSSVYSSGSSSNHASSGTLSDSGTGHVTRGGFGGYAHAFTSHFSGGG
ncbi:MAG: hypothetical protein Q7T86_07735 [Hyphomicrobiaceae bacterium]|nr:hypothetical protein [Hyphomicrobiaceae bacterium]